MAIAVASIIERAGFHLQDEQHIRWTVSELVSWVNEAAKAIVTRRPDAGAFVDNLVLVAGTKQALPDSVYRIIDVTRNMGTGSTPGRVVKRCDRALLDNADPDWHSRTPSAETRNYLYEDAANPQVFYVYPPAVANNVLEAILAHFPLDVSSDTDTVDMDASFEEAMLNFVLYRCYAKDSEYGDAGKAAAMYGAYQAALGEQVK